MEDEHQQIMLHRSMRKTSYLFEVVGALGGWFRSCIFTVAEGITPTESLCPPALELLQHHVNSLSLLKWQVFSPVDGRITRRSLSSRSSQRFPLTPSNLGEPPKPRRSAKSQKKATSLFILFKSHPLSPKDLVRLLLIMSPVPGLQRCTES